MCIGCSLHTFLKHNESSYMVMFVLKQGPFCPETWSVCPEAWSVLSWNVVRSVLRRGPFCPETWSVLSGPFCPWSVLSEYLRDILRALLECRSHIILKLLFIKSAK